MSDNNLTPERTAEKQLFKAYGKWADMAQFDVFVSNDREHVHIVDVDDREAAIQLRIHEARELRDWLNEVLS